MSNTVLQETNTFERSWVPIFAANVYEYNEFYRKTLLNAKTIQ